MLPKYRILLFTLLCIAACLISACEAKWDDPSRDAVFKECLKRNKDKPEREQRRYCTCFLRNAEQQYSSPEYFADPNMYSSVVFDCKDTARAFVADWPDSVKDQFLKTCVDMAILRNMKEPATYCLCLMERTILSMHGNRLGAGLNNSSMSGAISAIGLDCKKATPANIDSILKAGLPKDLMDKDKPAPERNYDPMAPHKKDVPLNPF